VIKTDTITKTPKKSKKSTTKTKSKTKPTKKVTKSTKKTDYKFVNYFQSEPQLDEITHKSDPEDILNAYERIIWVTAKKHYKMGRTSTELEDLIAQGQLGVCEAIKRYKNPNTRPRYKFHMLCLYNIRDYIFKYCIRNVNQLKTPVYIQRELMHVAQIFQLMNNQTVAEAILKREGPSTESEIIAFIYDEDERLPLKSKTFIKKQINKKVNKKEFEQIYNGIISHELGSRHSYVKNNLSDVGKILHIKEKIWYTFKSNNMKYERGIKLILSAKQSQDSLDAAIHSPIPKEVIEQNVAQKQLIDHGSKICGKLNFRILFENKCMDMNYAEISKTHNIKKNMVTDIIKKSIKLLQKDPVFQEMFKELF